MVTDGQRLIGPLHLPILVLASNVIAGDAASDTIARYLADDEMAWREMSKLFIKSHYR